MDSAVKQFLIYLRAVRNSSPNTIRSYQNDLEQFLAFLTPPGTPMPSPPEVTHVMIREFVAHLHDCGSVILYARFTSFLRFLVRVDVVNVDFWGKRCVFPEQVFRVLKPRPLVEIEDVAFSFSPFTIFAVCSDRL